MDVLRKYIISDPTIKGLINANVFLVEKPEKITAVDYIIYNYKELSGGYIKKYSVEFNLIGKDLNKLLAVKERLIEILDDTRNEIIIKDDKTTIQTSNLINGGGMIKNKETGNYHLVVYFSIQK